MVKIGAFVGEDTAKKTYSNECFDVRAWPGLSVVVDAVERAGYGVDFISAATIKQYDILLVSATSDCDMWVLAEELGRAQKGRCKIIMGGAGVLNVRPILFLADAFVLGRGEIAVVETIKAIENGDDCKDIPGVIWSKTFSPDNIYNLITNTGLYPHPVTLQNGKVFKESSIGCPNKCFFCGYTWQRAYIGDGTFTAGADSMAAGNREKLIKDIIRLPHDKWQEDGPIRIVAFDGCTERLRKMINKNLSDDDVRAFLTGLAKLEKPHQVKIYNIVGYPTETDNEWLDLVTQLERADKESDKTVKQWSLVYHFTPFRAMPHTPAALWPMSKRNYRGVIAEKLKQGKRMKGNIFYQGESFWAVEGMGTDSLSSVMKSAVMIRGTEADHDGIKKIAASRKKFEALKSIEKEQVLTKMFDCDKLFGEFTAGTIPTRYLGFTNYKDYQRGAGV